MGRVTAALLAAGMVFSTTSAEVLLQSDVVEVGVHDAFSFGISGNQPAGYHGNVGGQLGFVADYGRDGWAVGAPGFAGDFFLPGSPKEGWGIEWTDASGAKHAFNNFGRSSFFDVPMSSLTNTRAGGTQQAVWIGTAASAYDKLKLVQALTFKSR